jgi:hypothetical protein
MPVNGSWVQALRHRLRFSQTVLFGQCGAVEVGKTNLLPEWRMSSMLFRSHH